MGDHGTHGRAYLIVGLTEEPPALGVADNHVAHAEALEHARANFAREGPLFLEVAVLRAEGHRDLPVFEH